MGDSKNYSRPLNSSSGEVDGSRYLTRRCARCETEVRGFMQAGPGLRNPADWPTRCRFPRVSGLGCDVLSPVLANHKKRYILLPSSARSQPSETGGPTPGYSCFAPFQASSCGRSCTTLRTGPWRKLGVWRSPALSKLV
jgi:hypothetical protein